MMRYKLVIAEKPSVAQSLAAVIGATARKDGYLEGNGWRVSWCVGHLAGLADADSYDPKYAKWRYDDLPILPEHWQMVVGKDKKKQFDILKKLMNAPDVTEVVNACDAGREGELIFRSVYELAGCQKPMKRLWISSMEDSAIREGFANLRPGVDYDGLRDAALCRAKADWLVGINATRLFSVLYHRTLNIGRVMSPTLALIVQREAEIDTFKPVPFYTVALELPGLTVSGERISDRASAEQLKEACQGAAVTIKKVECKEKSEKPPALYDLTTLQRDANRLLGFTAQQTLDYLQSLYEKKLCTYPRTDSRYLTSDMADSLPVLVNLVANAMPFRKGIAITCDPQTVINDKKVTDHHAVIPTRNLKDADLSALPAGEKAVLELVALRLLCAVAQPHIYSETVVIAACAGGEFTAKGKTVKHPGWKALEDACRAKMKDAFPSYCNPVIITIIASISKNKLTDASTVIRSIPTAVPSALTAFTTLLSATGSITAAVTLNSTAISTSFKTGTAQTINTAMTAAIPIPFLIILAAPQTVCVTVSIELPTPGSVCTAR